MVCMYGVYVWCVCMVCMYGVYGVRREGGKEDLLHRNDCFSCGGIAPLLVTGLAAEDVRAPQGRADQAHHHPLQQSSQTIRGVVNSEINLFNKKKRKRKRKRELV